MTKKNSSCKDDSKELGLEVKAEKTKCVYFLSPECSTKL
jgi:hypothetical protein